uniref:DUF3453 domain-containing protein n=1 Tax=Bursaphelenchus xylophilus TaxID=6326 RepID=A0A1I7S0W8_BURXY
MASPATGPTTRSKTDLMDEEAIFLVELMAPCHKFLLGRKGSTLLLKGVATKVSRLSKNKLISAISQSFCAKFPRIPKDFDIEKWWRTTTKSAGERLETAEAFSEVDVAILRALHPGHPRVIALTSPNPQMERSNQDNSSESSSSSFPSTSTSPEPDLPAIPNLLNDALINLIREPTPPQKERRRSKKRKTEGMWTLSWDLH